MPTSGKRSSNNNIIYLFNGYIMVSLPPKISILQKRASGPGLASPTDDA